MDGEGAVECAVDWAVCGSFGADACAGRADSYLCMSFSASVEVGDVIPAFRPSLVGHYACYDAFEVAVVLGYWAVAIMYSGGVSIGVAVDCTVEVGGLGDGAASVVVGLSYVDVSVEAEVAVDESVGCSGACAAVVHAHSVCLGAVEVAVLSCVVGVEDSSTVFHVSVLGSRVDWAVGSGICTV